MKNMYKKVDVVPLGYYVLFWPKGYHPRRVLRSYVPGSEYPAPPLFRLEKMGDF